MKLSFTFKKNKKHRQKFDQRTKEILQQHIAVELRRSFYSQAFFEASCMMVTCWISFHFFFSNTVLLVLEGEVFLIIIYALEWLLTSYFIEFIDNGKLKMARILAFLYAALHGYFLSKLCWYFFEEPYAAAIRTAAISLLLTAVIIFYRRQRVTRHLSDKVLLSGVIISLASWQVFGQSLDYLELNLAIAVTFALILMTFKPILQHTFSKFIKQETNSKIYQTEAAFIIFCAFFSIPIIIWTSGNLKKFTKIISGQLYEKSIPAAKNPKNNLDN